ncbi:MAG TPA: alpha/beta hydrolase [Kofleriaceae bacterium]|jgi:pimeloyl-ACP methyl ester carboxylesterase|nr:alpha/beta hydrolase [Kofleriaceae bacterium]
MATIEIDGTSLYYEDTGPGSTGETIVFSHGLLWTTEQFAPQIAALRARYRCIAWDHRGQGRSATDHRESIGIELVWQDAVRLVEKLVGGPVHFCGLSMGGFVAMRMAARRPDLVRSLILLETSADPEPIENIARYRLLTRVVKLLGPRVIKNKVAPIMLGKTILTDKARRAELATFIDLMSRRRDIWRAVNGVVDRAGIHDELARITAPTLVAVGDEDVATPRPKAERIIAGITGATLVTIPRAGHSSPVEEPKLVTAAIEEFLQALPATR